MKPELFSSLCNKAINNLKMFAVSFTNLNKLHFDIT